MQRREFMTLAGGAVVWPLAARAQQPAMPVIGLLNGVSFNDFADQVAAFRQGLKDTGLVEGQSNTARRTLRLSDCRHWRPISFAGRSR
jgi:putative ABC transport system substrate-binding protein